jgi:hypothetical protein
MAINFSAQFIVNEKTSTRVLRLTDTSTGFVLAKGNFSVTFPDGTQVLHTDFVSPDINTPGGAINISLITDVRNAVLTGSYTVDFIALDATPTQYNISRTFDFNWIKPIKTISNQSDVVLPDIKFVDSTPYETTGNFTGVVTRDFYTYTPSGSEVGAIKKQSVGDILIPSHSSKYYEGTYLVVSDISVPYTHSSLSWLTVTYTDLLQETYDIREAPTQDELVALMNTYKDQIEAYKTTNPDEYARRNEEYDLVIGLYSHLLARYETTTLDGCKSILDQLLGLLPPTNPYSYKATQMLPFNLSPANLLSFKVSDGTTLDPINKGETLTFESANAGLSIAVTDNKLTFTAKTAYVHTQTVAAAVWTIVHNLGKYPSVSIVDSANDEVIGEVRYTNTNQVVVTFSAAFSGKAFLN